MEFKVTLKDPDAFYEAITEAIERCLEDVKDPEEREAVREIRRERLGQFISRWVEYGEYVTIVFNDDLNTALVEQVK